MRKNRYGSMVVMSIERHAQLTDDIELILDEADRVAKEKDVRYTHEKIFSRVRRSIGGR